MERIIPEKLKQGDEIRIIAPSRSLKLLSEENISLAKEKLKGMGFKVTFSKNCEESDDFISSSIKSRIEDLHEAFKDKNVKMILPVIGGFNSNQLLKYIDYNIIKENPKIVGGYSDTTALQNAIYAKTGLVTYSSPAYSTFAMKKGFQHIEEYFNKCLTNIEGYNLIPSKDFSNDAWYRDQDNRTFIKNPEPYFINEGTAEGILIGGNLCTLNLLQGTEYMPLLKDAIIFLEDDENSNILLFDRDLQSLIHQPDFEKVKGIVIGRFEEKSEVKKDLLIKIIKSKEELKNLPVVAGLDFGHTYPMVTFPIGGRVKIDSENGKPKITILEH